MQTPRIYIWIIATLSLLAPKESSLEWRREWEAEVTSRWLHLKKWERLTLHNKFDLLMRVLGSVLDVLNFQRRRTHLVLIAINLLVALFTAFGALQQFVNDGIRGREFQPILLSLGAIIVGILFVTSAIALLRQWPTVHRLITFTGTLSILLHVYGALPPHRNMGFPVLIVGVGYGLVMLLVSQWNERRNPVLR